MYIQLKLSNVIRCTYMYYLTLEFFYGVQIFWNKYLIKCKETLRDVRLPLLQPIMAERLGVQPKRITVNVKSVS